MFDFKRKDICIQHVFIFKIYVQCSYMYMYK